MISRQHHCIFVHIPHTGGQRIEDVIWPGERQIDDLWMGFVRPHYNKYQTGGLQHLFARHIRLEVGEETFHDSFKFSIVRNPWDRMVSQFRLLEERPDLRDFMRIPEGTAFTEYIDMAFLSGHVQVAPQVDFLYAEDGEPLVDFVGRYETFERDAHTVFERLGLEDACLPLAPPVTFDYRGYYDDDSAARVAALYEADIARFGYSF